MKYRAAVFGLTGILLGMTLMVVVIPQLCFHAAPYLSLSEEKRMVAREGAWYDAPLGCLWLSVAGIFAVALSVASVAYFHARLKVESEFE